MFAPPPTWRGCLCWIGRSYSAIPSTVLVNRAVVLLNYRLGDRAAWLPEPCPCGRSLPLLSWVRGRRSECVRLPSGATVAVQTLADRLADVQGLWDFQVLQRSWSEVEVRLLTAGDADQGEIGARTSAAPQGALGDGLRIDLRFVPSLACTAGGKVRRLITPSDEEWTAQMLELGPTGSG